MGIIGSYTKYFQWIDLTFRFQILKGEDGHWMRIRHRSTGELDEFDLPDFSLDKLNKDLQTINGWNVFNAKKYAPYFKKLLEDTGVCTKVETVLVRPQRLFLHEERPDLVFSALITVKTREYSTSWQKHLDKQNDC